MKHPLIIIALFSVSSLVFGYSIFETEEGEKILVSLKKEFYGAKMGPVGVAPKLEIHPPEGGIEGLFPIYGVMDLPEKILFRWRGEKILGLKPAFVFFEEGQKKHTPFFIANGAKQIALTKEVLHLKRGQRYHWYLGRMENGKPIAQTRVYSLSILSEKEQTDLNQEIKALENLGLKTKGEEEFLKGQILYQYQMFHDMIDLLKPLYRQKPAKGVRRFLFLGYAKLGRHREAQKFKD